MTQLLYGFLLAVIVAFAAYRAHSLSTSGALAAVLIGTVIFGLGGWQWAVILLVFFISSSLLSRLFAKRKSSLNEKFDKGGQRDAGQVLANGGIAALFAGLHFFLPSASWPWLAFTASLAAVNADTWATELGVLNPTPPRLITTGHLVEKGTSGGISWGGTLAALAGAGLVAACAQLVRPGSGFLLTFSFTTLAGLLGAFFDSFLGATFQAIYTCPHCNKETERHPVHTCGTATTHLRGFKWLNNDLVNVGCALAGSLLGLAFLRMVG
ncbi:MAG: hypothetical protein A2X25_08860 [Chloroflexi bacterium GWB2_49_20]|nr:MAG: hypothetical protein A2X25_08860 [Chloroflexi bacterium GWB2_49_20]OGN79456.1 MAG: hypothetical protein A2X26_05165 [Chloroflexi bacterium GWC2_49_37]OGN82775.1 MAG: hypothetical protein A2X27_07530 [Chloroflexi bacterium GWD2_49_16]HCC79673.1 DUF92 domain-containing protein [Anaerolineae bacterium]HCM97245.1 DUF92 domain-containing protein [Anaerolineae bacterium]